MIVVALVPDLMVTDLLDIQTILTRTFALDMNNELKDILTNTNKYISTFTCVIVTTKHLSS